MKKWSLLVACLYGVTLLVLLFPLTWAAFKRPEFSEFAEILGEWQTWFIIALMSAAQFALLRVPVASATGRPVARRSIWATVIAAAFMMGLLVLGGVASIIEFFKHSKGIDAALLVLILGLLSWVFWAIYFYRATSARSATQTTSTLQKYLWRGSILELLIAVPTHIVARHRDYCCAGFMTFIGLTCGVAVMVFAFGPALYFLFIERWRRLHPSPE